ncbi:MAG: hypothetical protein NC935_08540 [Candidatus Omnitrophica bacterium]|nr:hypothetical protein [Candidatus Omnitrophota bacterium]
MKAKIKKIRELWQKLLEQKPTNDDLRYIIEYVDSLREEAVRKLTLSKEEILEKMRELF